MPPLVAVFLAVASTGALVAEQAPELRQAAERGNADAQFDLGEAYYEGEGEEQDYVTAAAWWRRAAAQGHAPAQYNLGVMYATGQGVSQNAATAFTWYRRAAEQGDALGQLQLGVITGGAGASRRTT